MSDQKPGCIHPGDPEGWCGSFMVLGLGLVGAVAGAVLLLVRAVRR